MGELASQAGRKLVAVGILLLATYVLFKIVVGFVASIVWIAVVVAAVIGIVWALRVLQGRVEFLVICVFFGLSAGVVAKIKGSSFLIWFLIGAVLPFVGTVAALLWRNDRDLERAACPECGNVVAIHDQVCTRCGADLDLFAPEPVQRQERLFEG